jgi:MFS family permease
MRASVALTWRDRVLRDLGFVAGAYVGTQLTVMTYFVTFLNLELGHSLVVAGFVFSVVQITGVLGRVLWGAVGDRMRRPRLLLGALGVASGIAAVLIALVLVVGIFFGTTGLSWNGLYFAEVARRVRREDVSRATGAGMFFSFLGGISGPVIFALVVPGAGGGGFALGFGLIAVMAFVAGTYLIARTPRIVPAPD